MSMSDNVRARVSTHARPAGTCRFLLVVELSCVCVLIVVIRARGFVCRYNSRCNSRASVGSGVFPLIVAVGIVDNGDWSIDARARAFSRCLGHMTKPTTRTHTRALVVCVLPRNTEAPARSAITSFAFNDYDRRNNAHLVITHQRAAKPILRHTPSRTRARACVNRTEVAPRCGRTRPLCDGYTIEDPKTGRKKTHTHIQNRTDPATSALKIGSVRVHQPVERLRASAHAALSRTAQIRECAARVCACSR